MVVMYNTNLVKLNQMNDYERGCPNPESSTYIYEGTGVANYAYFGTDSIAFS
jgi:hypothetical protein